MKKIISLLSALALILTMASITAGAVSKPAAPELTTVKNTAKGVVIKWKKVNNADGYYIYSKSGSSGLSKLDSTDSTSYTHKKAVSGRNYSYVIYAYNDGGKSSASNLKSLICVTTPKLKTSNTKKTIKVTWTKVKSASKYVLIGKKASAKKYKVLYSGKKRSYLLDNMTGAKYTFKIKATVKGLDGAYSAAKTQVFLTAPSLRAEELIDMKGITLTWNTVKNAKGYIIYRSLKSENSYKKIKKITSKNTRKYVDSDLVSINSYKYYIVAYNGASRSVKSNIDSDVYGYIDNFSTPLTLTIRKGEVYRDIFEKLDYYKATSFIVWTSENPDIATVDLNGIITGVSKGTATLRATIDPELGTIYGRKINGAKTITFILTVK